MVLMGCEYSKVYWEKAKEKFHLFKEGDLKFVLEIGANLCSVCPAEYKEHCSRIRSKVNDVIFDDDCMNSAVSNE